MCGIAGIYKLNNEAVEKSTLIRFTDSMFHRGPDGAGYELFENNTLGLGQRRLAILDLSEAGRQPMSYADQRYWITYNGEVFNFEEIKKELMALGFHFKSNTDTEVILAAYTQWGKDCLSKLNGMWAFAIWDKQNKELFLSRDRFGIKPLYYIYQPNKLFAFASETRAFKFLDNFNRNFDEELLQINIADTYALEGCGLTPFKDIVQLLPGHFITIRKDKIAEQKRWWHIDDYRQTDIPKIVEEQAEKFYDLFRDACKIRLISDVPIATALSGGLDSSAVYSTVYDILNKEHLSRANPNSQKAFTAVFAGLPNDEAEYAKKAAEFCNTQTNFVGTDFSNLPQLIERETELVDCINTSPITSISGIYAGMKKNGITVSMDGHGVDEMMYGYRSMIYALYNNAFANKSVGEAREIAKVLSNMYHPDERQKVKSRFENELSAKEKNDKNILKKLLKTVKGKTEVKGYLTKNIKPIIGEPYNFNELNIEERMLYNDFFQATLPSLLRNFDRAGMVNSVEIRMPFMDWRLVSYVFSLQETSKVGNGFTKLLLRNAMKNKMHEEIRTRTFKVGIGSPVEYWFNGVLKTWVLDNIRDNNLKENISNKYKQGNLTNKDAHTAWKHINVNLIS